MKQPTDCTHVNVAVSMFTRERIQIIVCATVIVAGFNLRLIKRIYYSKCTRITFFAEQIPQSTLLNPSINFGSLFNMAFSLSFCLSFSGLMNPG